LFTTISRVRHSEYTRYIYFQIIDQWAFEQRVFTMILCRYTRTIWLPIHIFALSPRAGPQPAIAWGIETDAAVLNIRYHSRKSTCESLPLNASQLSYMIRDQKEGQKMQLPSFLARMDFDRILSRCAPEGTSNRPLQHFDKLREH
jgi:hypothetical protein